MWTNKKYPKFKYQGQYSRLRGERVFEVCRVACGRAKPHRVTFESWEAAKALGWVKK